MVKVIYDYVTDEETCRGIVEEFDTREQADKCYEDLLASPIYCNIDIFDESDLY